MYQNVQVLLLLPRKFPPMKLLLFWWSAFSAHPHFKCSGQIFYRGVLGEQHVDSTEMFLKVWVKLAGYFAQIALFHPAGLKLSGIKLWFN